MIEVGAGVAPVSGRFRVGVLGRWISLFATGICFGTGAVGAVSKIEPWAAMTEVCEDLLLLQDPSILDAYSNAPHPIDSGSYKIRSVYSGNMAVILSAIRNDKWQHCLVTSAIELSEIEVLALSDAWTVFAEELILRGSHWKSLLPYPKDIVAGPMLESCFENEMRVTTSGRLEGGEGFRVGVTLIPWGCDDGKL